ncbi:Cas1p-domain-containing protein [Hysterangium stoloniferum]|nr:Cas1p-domain-containing protein [Hysterangium stoloniferum]
MPPVKRSSTSWNPMVPHWLAVGGIAVTLVMGLFKFLFIDSSDPYHCGALLTEGQWLDDKFTNWQPEGCMLHNYGPKDISTCLSSRRVVFIGDSVTRQLFFSLAHTADNTLPSTPPEDNQKHSDHNYVSKEEIEFSFMWDPYLNTTRTRQLLRVTDVTNASSTPTIRTPAMLVVGTGLWFLRYESSGGLAKWERTIKETLETISKANGQLADAIVLLPVENVISSKLLPERADTIRNPDIDAMNTDIRQRVNPPSMKYSLNPSHIFRQSSPYSQVSFPAAFNVMLDPTQTADGLHYSDNILKAQTNILLNLRCNEELPKKFPLDKTCCRSYPSITFYQLLIIVILAGWGPIAKFVASGLVARHPKLQAFFPNEEHVLPLSTFGFAIFLIFLADRTSIWSKEHKQYDPFVFGGWVIVCLLLGLVTMKRVDKDLGFLNREQTDEWKGWMQIAILIYHYFGASKISGIYNPIRVLVAAYLFMTGYGHTIFYIRKADFVLVRLNMLPVALAYTMNTDYLSYYFSPLVSMWYLVIYATMAIGRGYNDRTPFLLLKFFISMVAVTLFMRQTSLLEEVFSWLDRLCRIHWSAKEWSFRVNLDLWIVYFGMITALVFLKIRELRLTDHPRWPLVYRASLILSVVTLIWFFIFELSQPSKFTYNKWHPYVSVLPIVAFAVLRNANPILRSASSRAFAFIGTCSLETFIIQYHFWLGADTKGILLVIPGTKWRPVNILVSTLMFIWLSHKVANATVELTAWFCGAPQKALPTSAPTRGTANVSAPEEHIPLAEVAKLDDGAERMEPATPSPPQRWVDRLADASQPTHTSGFRVFSDNSDWTNGLGFRLAITGFSLWFLNMTWST